MCAHSFFLTGTDKAGHFIWTINLGVGEIDIRKDGIVELVAPQGSGGRRFLTTAAPNPCTTSQTFGNATLGSAAHANHTLELTAPTRTPTPGVASLLGLSGLGATHCRRA
ncbi:MAG: hypothetical protein NTV94_12220 [Planctomycetota bacterium]|nr:hypothetical protein [Planctomycetota bacterium]